MLVSAMGVACQVGVALEPKLTKGPAPESSCGRTTTAIKANESTRIAMSASAPPMISVEALDASIGLAMSRPVALSKPQYVHWL